MQIKKCFTVNEICLDAKSLIAMNVGDLYKILSTCIVRSLDGNMNSLLKIVNILGKAK